ncbi:hypothetical protein MPER_12351 [Moniliophthora perniciosa FA553]|nr:hypothetical protein MPER_12351 [Moniliophthora perniciosa FA553]
MLLELGANSSCYTPDPYPQTIRGTRSQAQGPQQQPTPNGSSVPAHPEQDPEEVERRKAFDEYVAQLEAERDKQADWNELEEWRKAGGFWARGIDLYMLDIDMVMKFGFEDETWERGDKRSALFSKWSKDKMYLTRKAYQRFKEKYPELHERLEQCLEYKNMIIFSLCTATMKAAATNIRKADSATIKPRILDYILNNPDLGGGDASLDPPIAHKDDKHERGFHHPMTTRYLVPRANYPDYLFDAEEYVFLSFSARSHHLFAAR